MAGRMKHANLRAGNGDDLTVSESSRRTQVGVGEKPDGRIGRVKQDRRSGRFSELGGKTHVIVMCVGARDGDDLAAAYDRQDCFDVVRRIDDDAFDVIADDPHVVVDVKCLAVQ
ncbi:unannotated protein [freshwater metagenome]|uniref:Unannotated protein n=1 Tax=freshwater metagenome TaxID=449393 RepID=A0A6J7M367_9ZZZZ